MQGDGGNGSWDEKAEGCLVAGKERMREKHKDEEREDGDFAKRFWVFVWSGIGLWSRWERRERREGKKKKKNSPHRWIQAYPCG